MRHRKHKFKIGRRPAHRRAMLANMACSLFISGRIQTTLTRAKEVRRLVEKMITLAKNGSLASRRRAIAILGQKAVVKKLFDETVERFQERQGGYTRILKIGIRQGDAADMCFLELVTEPMTAKATIGETAAPAEATSEEEPVASETATDDQESAAKES